MKKTVILNVTDKKRHIAASMAKYITQNVQLSIEIQRCTLRLVWDNLDFAVCRKNFNNL